MRSVQTAAAVGFARDMRIPAAVRTLVNSSSSSRTTTAMEEAMAAAETDVRLIQHQRKVSVSFMPTDRYEELILWQQSVARKWKRLLLLFAMQWRGKKVDQPPSQSTEAWTDY